MRSGDQPRKFAPAAGRCLAPPAHRRRSGPAIAHDGVTYLPLDYHDPATIQAITKSLPRVDVLINNAASARPAPWEGRTVGRATRCSTSMYSEPLELTRAYLPTMRANHGGTIIFMDRCITELPVHYKQVRRIKTGPGGLWPISRHEKCAPYGIRTVLVEPGYIPHRHRPEKAVDRAARAARCSCTRSTTVKRKVDHAALSGSRPRPVGAPPGAPERTDRAAPATHDDRPAGERP